MTRRCAGRAAAAGASQSGWAGSGTGSSRIPPGRTGISPGGSRCEQRPTGHKRLADRHAQARPREGERQKKKKQWLASCLKPSTVQSLTDVFILHLTFNSSQLNTKSQLLQYDI